MPDPDGDVERATAAFIGGLCLNRSRTHPYGAERIGPLTVMRDGPRRRGEYRIEERVVRRTPAAEAYAPGRPRRGRTFATLTASHTGALLYPVVGYR